MKLKPGYKQTEVGVIPEGWEVRRLRDVAVIATGNTPPTNDMTNYGDEFLFVSPADLGETKDITRTEKLLSKKGFSIARRFPKNSILVVCIGSTIGKCGIASVDLTANQQINAIFPSASFSCDYLYYAVSAAAQKIKFLAGEQAVPLVNKSQFAETCVAFPPLPEQHTIAEALSDMDALLTGLEKLIAKKRALKQAAMQQLLTGTTRLPGFRGEWEVKKFDDVLVRLNVKQHQIQASDYQPIGECPVVDQGQSTIAGFSDRVDKKMRCPDGGVIVFGDHTCLVKFIDFDFLVGADGTQVIRSRVMQNTMFYAFQLQYRGIEPTGYNRHFKLLQEHTFLVPPLPEQHAIAEILSDMDAEIEALELQRKKTVGVKQGMMQELLTGRVRLV
ncbi:MAG: restriction endonuclease subunit S [Armatimonadetes bacterium]|nr:restriction endonuclease subunit S [Armatimonadota bacterium]